MELNDGFDRPMGNLGDTTVHTRSVLKPHGVWAVISPFKGRTLTLGGVPDQESVLRERDLNMDLVRRKVTRGDAVIGLLPREFALLEHLLRRKGRVPTRTMLLEALWDLEFAP